jgi:3-oxoadipate enol-lactonase
VVSGAGAGEPEFRDPATRALLARWAAAEQARDREAWTEIVLRLGSGPERALADVDPDVLARVRAMADDTIDHHVPAGAPVAAVPVPDAATRAGDLRVPVLAIIGLLDAPDHRRLARELAGTVPDGRVVEIPGAAHYPNLERPREFTDALLAFLRA